MLKSFKDVTSGNEWISFYKYDNSDPEKANDQPWAAQINYGQATPTVQTS